MNYIPLTQVCDFQGGSQPPKEQWIDHAEEGYIRMLQIRDFTQPDKDNIEYVRVTKTIKTCNEDDILIGRYGASVGKILTGLSGAYNVAIIKTIPDASKLTKRFLYHYLNSPYFQSFILSVGSRAAQAGFNKEDLSDAQIPQLSLKEQEYVTAQLDKIVDLMVLRKQQLSKLDELVKARFVELFGDPISNPKRLPVKTLKQLSTLITNGNTPKGGSENYVKEGILFLRSQNVWRNRIDLDDVAYIDKATHYSMRKSSLKHKDILITKTGRINTENSSLGRAALYLGDDDSANINGHVYLVRLDGSVVPEYVVTILTGEAYRKYIRKVCVGGIDKRQINLDQVEEFPIILPSVEFQKQFAAFVEKVEKSKIEIQKSLEKLETLKKALMQKYFG